MSIKSISDIDIESEFANIISHRQELAHVFESGDTFSQYGELVVQSGLVCVHPAPIKLKKQAAIELSWKAKVPSRIGIIRGQSIPNASKKIVERLIAVDTSVLIPIDNYTYIALQKEQFVFKHGKNMSRKDTIIGRVVMTVDIHYAPEIRYANT